MTSCLRDLRRQRLITTRSSGRGRHERAQALRASLEVPTDEGPGDRHEQASAERGRLKHIDDGRPGPPGVASSVVVSVIA